MGRRAPSTGWWGGWTTACLCAPEMTVLWHQKIFRMSSSFFQEPLRSNSPRSFMPKDLRRRGSNGGVQSCLGHCASQLRGLVGPDQVNVLIRGA